RCRLRILLTIVLVNGFSVWAADKSGVIRKDETWEGVITVTGDVTIPEGITVRIRPNTLIRFMANQDDEAGGIDVAKSELIVEGILRAEGQEKFQIRFTSSNFTDPGEKGSTLQPQAGDWYGLIFRRGEDRSILSNCVIEFAYDGITCINSSPRIFRNRIEGNYWNGILCDIMSTPKINNNQIQNNGYAGINAKINSAPSINANEITGNRYGVLVQDVSKPLIGDTRLGENSGKNAIYNNLEFNLYNHTKNVVYAQRNDWGDNFNADRFIHDDDENNKFGLVVFTPVYSTGNISYLEFKNIAADAPTDTKAEQEKRRKEIEDLKRQLAQAKPTDKAGGAGLTESERQKRAEDARKEKERLALLEEQLKQQEQIRIEQERRLALQKQQEEDQKKTAAAATVKQPVVTVNKETAAATTTPTPEASTTNAASAGTTPKPVESKPAAPVFVPTKMANELDNNPKALQKVSPVMPDLAKKAKLNGTVSMRVLVGTDGKPEEIYVSKRIGNKDWDQMINDAAIAAVKQWLFEQGLSGGVPVKYWTVVTVLMK
ncbi:MAG TPA: energy transducer TonB, partial [bacterium]|nr:energy transducer TonB [bacterium]